MKKLLLWVFIVGSNFWANAQVQVVVVAWQYEELTITQDSLNYKYNAGTNQLQYITDSVPTTNYTTDIDTKTPNNYGYDGSGNMIRDSIQGFFVNWSPYGKIRYVLKPSNNRLDFGYNAMQQRVLKRVVTSGDTVRTYYIRDAQGNTMGVYTRHNDSVTWREQYIFGSSRLGLYRADTLVNKGLQVISKLYEGKRNYELTNHLGNVMAVINDRKTDSLSGTTKVGFNAVVISATDYFPFGMAIDSRSYTSSMYRYGFNGKENDKETGEIDFGARIYDPRIGKFLSIDPLTGKNTGLSPYTGFANNPIFFVDPDGNDNFIYVFFIGKAKTRLTIEQQRSIIEATQYLYSVHGLNVKVKMLNYDNKGAIDQNLLDKTDRIVYFGDQETINKMKIPGGKIGSLFLAGRGQSGDSGDQSIAINYSAYEFEGINSNHPWEDGDKLKAIDFYARMDKSNPQAVAEYKKQHLKLVKAHNGMPIDLPRLVARTISHEIGHTIIGAGHPDEHGLDGVMSVEPNIMSSGGSGMKVPFPFEQLPASLNYLSKHRETLWRVYNTRGNSVDKSGNLKWEEAPKPTDNFSSKYKNRE